MQTEEALSESQGSDPLTYDMTFVILLLSGLYEPPTKKGTSRCMVHPVRKQPVRKNKVTEYTTDTTCFCLLQMCGTTGRMKKAFRLHTLRLLKNKRTKKIEALEEKTAAHYKTSE